MMHSWNENIVSLAFVFKDGLLLSDGTSCELMFIATYHVTDMNLLGNCCRSRGNYNEAISWHEKARQLLQQQHQSPRRDEVVAAS